MDRDPIQPMIAQERSQCSKLVPRPCRSLDCEQLALLGAPLSDCHEKES